MKICVCATGPNLDSLVSAVFGRCPYFLIVDSKTEEFKAISNSALQAGRGAGVTASQLVASEKAGVVICGNFGPNAFSILQMSGIKIYPGVFGLTVKQALDKYNKRELKEMKISTAPGPFTPPGRGRGRGRGFGPSPRRQRRRGY
jgi:predicted Fe-Mo cluster-binding NifX family protein